MAALTTPSRPIVVNDNAAQHTRASELPTPFNLQRNPKKKRTEPTPAASSSNQPGKTAARQNDDIATTAILNQLDEMERQARTKKQVIGDLARCLDSFVASYKGDHQRETRKQARGLVEMLVGHLNTAIFSASGGALYAPIRLMSSELTQTDKSPAASSSRSPPAPLASALKQPGPPASKQVSWAEVAASNKGSSFGGASLHTGGTATSRKTSNPLQPGKEDPRILIRLGSERLQSRDSPFSLRNAIISEFGDLNLSLTDIPHIQPIKTGWAIKAGSKRVRELLLEPDNKVRLGRVMAAEAVEVPEHWYSYAVTQVCSATAGRLGSLTRSPPSNCTTLAARDTAWLGDAIARLGATTAEIGSRSTPTEQVPAHDRPGVRTVMAPTQRAIPTAQRLPGGNAGRW